MAYSLVYKQSVRHDLGRLSTTEITRILDRIEHELLAKPTLNPVLKGKFAGLRKYRIGDYRIIYALKGDEIIVLRIGLDELLIETAKRQAGCLDKSVSQLVADDFALIANDEPIPGAELTPRIRAMIGSLKGATVSEEDFPSPRDAGGGSCERIE